MTDSESLKENGALAPVHEDVEQARVDLVQERDFRQAAAGSRQRPKTSVLVRRSAVARNFQEEHLMQILSTIRPGRCHHERRFASFFCMTLLC